MDINTNNSSGMMNGLPPEKKEDRKVGPIVGALVIVLIIVSLALYFFGKRLNVQNPQANINTQTTSTPNVAQTATVSSSSDMQSVQDSLDIQLKDVDYSF